MPGDARRGPPDRDALRDERIGLPRLEEPPSGIGSIDERTPPLAAADLDAEVEGSADQGPPKSIAPRSRVDSEVATGIGREHDLAAPLDGLDPEVVIGTAVEQAHRPLQVPIPRIVKQV